MPVAVSYPGVYVEEIPSSVHTITGVATSIAAFIGWAAQGPIMYAGLCLSWSDFQRIYGGFDARSPYLGYAVSQFFINGGQQAYIVRLAYTGASSSTLAPAASATLTLGGLAFTAGTVGPDGIVANATNPGVWAQSYGIAIKNQTQVPATNRFRVQVVYAPPGAASEVVVESYENLSIVTPDPQGRYVADVINKQSSFVTVAVTSGTTTPPPDTPVATQTTPLPSPKLAGTVNDDGTVLLPTSVAGTPLQFEVQLPAAMPILDQIDLFNLLCVPGEIVTTNIQALEAYCETRRAFLIADADPSLTDPTRVTGTPTTGMNSAYYYPWIQAPDPLNQNRPNYYPPCGFVAGIYARTDGTRGVWKAPAGTEATLTGASGVMVPLNDRQNGLLNPLGVNCIRNFNVYGTIVWGARTMQGNDELGSQWKYIPVRRTALFIEESLYRALKWAVFEPNDNPLWAELRLNVGAFMQNLFRQGAFQGQTPADAYFVKCDDETTTQNDINLGIVNILVGFAPLQPAEFVVIQIQQMAGQIAT
jgi:phage tail sheath protein FI